MIKIYLLIVFLFCTTTIQAQKDIGIKSVKELVNSTHTKRTLALSPFYEEGIRYMDSVEIFNQILEVEKAAEKANDNELLLEAELMRVHYFCYRLYFPKEFVVNMIETLNQKAKDQKVLWLEIRTHSLLGNYLYHFHKDYASGFEHLERTVQLLEGQKSADYPLKQIYLYHLADVYMDFNEYDEAKPYLLKALQASYKYDRYYYKMHILNGLGICYKKAQDFDSSNHYFNLTLKNAIHHHDKVWESISYTNLGANNYRQSDYKTAKHFIEKSITFDDSMGDYDIGKHTLQGNILLKTGKIQEAKNVAYKLKLMLKKLGIESRTTETYVFLSKIAVFSNKPELSVAYIDTAFAIKDSIAKVFDGMHLLRAKQRIELEKRKLEEEKLRQADLRQIQTRNSIIVGLTLVFIVLFLLYNRYRLKSKNREQLITTEKNAAEESLKNAQLRLQDFQKSIQSKNAIIMKFEEELKAASQQLSNLTTESKEVLSFKAKKEVVEQLQEATILTEKDWREFVELFEKVHPDFFSRLNKKYENLTKSEVRLIALCRLKLNNTEMSLMLGVGTAAIRQSKSRLRKKIDLKENDDLESLASQI